VEEIVAVMREAGRGIHGARVRGLIVYLQGIENTGVISAVRSRRAPVMPARAGLLMQSAAQARAT
jgi:hypothetical protein